MLKEGINLKNNEYTWGMVIESHYIEDIEQMWGRVRSGLSYCAIIHNSEQYQKCYTKKDTENCSFSNSCRLLAAQLIYFHNAGCKILRQQYVIHFRRWTNFDRKQNG